jgi:hypothetical protein
MGYSGGALPVDFELPAREPDRVDKEHRPAG